MTKTSRSRAGTQFVGLFVAVLGASLATACKKPEDAPAPAPSAATHADKTPPPEKEKAAKAPPPEKEKAPPPSSPSGPDPSMERFSNAAADNQIDVPKDWTHNPVGESLVIISPDKQVFIELSASLAMGKDKADEKKLMARLGKSLQGARRVGPIVKAEQNGLSGWKFAGTAKKGGKAYDWESFALEDPAGKGAFGLVYASKADLASHRVLIDKILNSISSVAR